MACRLPIPITGSRFSTRTAASTGISIPLVLWCCRPCWRAGLRRMRCRRSSSATTSTPTRRAGTSRTCWAASTRPAWSPGDAYRQGSAPAATSEEDPVSTPEAVFHQPRSIPLPRRIVARLAVAAARLLATQSPRRIRTVLGWLRRGVRPASFEQAKAARDTVVAVSLACASREGCVPRSLATVLLCRLRGQWPAWCVGARRLPPFAAHAWVEADGIMVGEDYPADYFRLLFKEP